VAGGAEKSLSEARAKIGVAPGCGDTDDLQFRAGNGERQRKGIVDVVADVGIEDDLLLLARRGWLLGLEAAPVTERAK
jgi:hypothetical protein